MKVETALFLVLALAPFVAWPAETHPSNPAELEALLTEVQRAGVRYFCDFGHPVSGLAREGSDRDKDLCAIGASGMGFFNFIVAIERGFVARARAAERLQTTLRFLAEKAERFHGAFPHWINGATGKTIPFSRDDDGADLVETAFLAQGLLALREYFSAANPIETEIRATADRLWREIEWDWFAKQTDHGACLFWHWSPKYEWKKNLPIRGFNECHIVYLLALASPPHSVSPMYYWEGWHHPHFSQTREQFDIRLSLGHGIAPPLFWIHYSYLGFDPRTLSFNGKPYFDHFRDLCRVQVEYARSKADTFKGYGPLWGLTASLGPDGYSAFAPGPKDKGTIAPTAALSSLPYVPEESVACLLELHRHHRAQLWGSYGFRDAFNLTRKWVAPGYLGIDVGPIAPMIENHRSGLCWKTFMKAPEISVALKRLRGSESQEKSITE